MENFWDFSVWGTFNLITVLLLSLIIAQVLKKAIPILSKSLIPTSVLGGIILLIISTVYTSTTRLNIFNSDFFGGKGIYSLEIITYHALALGFISQSLKISDKKTTKKRAVEIFNTGVTTVSTYILQGIVGLAVTLVAALVAKDFFSASGILLPFGYGQGTGQALNYGSIYETDYGFVGGKSFGLTIAALGFLSASIGGVIYLNVLKRRGKVFNSFLGDGFVSGESIQPDKELEMNGSMDKMTFQVAFVCLSYLLAFGVMYLLGLLLPGMKATIFGFNFLFGVLTATLVKLVLKILSKRNILKKQYINNFLLTRISNLCFDVMVVAGIGAIQLTLIKDYWLIFIILGVLGLVITYAYNAVVARKLFPEYKDEQFLAMFGMLTGTASTGIMLLREVDGEFCTPVADNLVYQNFPAIVFGFPIMLLASLAPKAPLLTLVILCGFFVVMNVILFRNKIFRRKKQRRN